MKKLCQFAKLLLRAVMYEFMFFCIVLALFLTFYSRKDDRIFAMSFLGVIVLLSITLTYRSMCSYKKA
jgi:hypothetical protein